MAVKDKAKRVNLACLPVTKQPPPCQLQDWMNLTEMAFVLGKLLGHPVTVMQVVGALRAQGLKEDTRKFPAMSRGCIIPKQQTMAHRSVLKPTQKYFEERYGSR